MTSSIGKLLVIQKLKTNSIKDDIIHLMGVCVTNTMSTKGHIHVT